MAIPQMLAVDAVGKVASNKSTPIVLGLVVLAGGLASYFIVVRPVLQALNIIDSEDDKSEADIMNLKAFDPNFSDPTKVTLSATGAKKLASDLYDSLNWYGDKENKIYYAIQQAGTNHNMSVVSRYFAIEYKEALSAFLVENLNVEEMTKIKDIVDKF